MLPGWALDGLRVPLAQTGLELVLPNGTTRYIALGYSGDILAGTIDELAVAGYARVAHSVWVTEVGATEVRRKNNGAVLFDPLTDGAKEIAWWAIFDASTGGNMIAAGRILNGFGDPEPQSLGAGDQMRFDDGALRLLAFPEEV